MDGSDKYGIETWYNTEENVWMMAESFDLLIPKNCVPYPEIIILVWNTCTITLKTSFVAHGVSIGAANGFEMSFQMKPHLRP